MNQCPDWKIPADLTEILTRDESWEDNRWEPIRLTVFRGTSYQERQIPCSWQIEFEPGDAFVDRNASQISEDGYAWAQLIREAIAWQHPEILNELHLDDSESETCVVWVESEATCKILLETVWRLIQTPSVPESSP